MTSLNQKFLLHNSIDTKCSGFVRQAITNAYNKPEYQEIFSAKNTDTVYINTLSRALKARFKTIVIVGTGASSIISRILVSLSNTDLDIRFLENLDAKRLDQVFCNLEATSTAFIVISKSGRTVEILELFSICLNWMKQQLRSSAYSHFYCMTLPSQDNMLHQMIQQHQDINVITHPNLVGRYAFFSCLGLLPAALCGFDIESIVHRYSSYQNLTSYIVESASYFLSMSQHYSNVVLINYTELLQGLSVWFRQLISESLGKSGKGINPIIFEGSIDQHSQLQAYIDGPNDKFFIVLAPTKQLYQKISSLSRMKLLSSKANDINLAQLDSVLQLLQKAKKNIRVIEVNDINEEFISGIVASFMMESILYAEFNNIDPFSQTAIDCMKNLVTNRPLVC